MENIPYQEAIGSLLYLAQGTRPDISYAVNFLSKFNKCFAKEHWQAVKRVFRYLKGTLDTVITYDGNENNDMVIYSDADFAGDLDDRRSCSGYISVQQNGAISWASKRQQTVALSTTEAEYMALSAAVQEAEWLYQLRRELLNQSDAVKMYCDNKSSICLAKTNMYSSRTKHIDVKHHFVREKISEGEIVVEYISTDQMAADFLTKPLTQEKMNTCKTLVGLRTTKSHSSGGVMK